MSGLYPPRLSHHLRLQACRDPALCSAHAQPPNITNIRSHLFKLYVWGTYGERKPPFFTTQVKTPASGDRQL